MKSVWVTRSDEDCEYLRAQYPGIRWLSLPVTRIVSLVTEERLRDWRRVVSQSDWMMCTSFRGSQCALKLGTIPGVKVGVFGERTASGLERAADFVATGLSAVSLVDAEPNWQGKRVAFVRAKNGREELPKALEKAGADVSILPMYETIARTREDIRGHDTFSTLAKTEGVCFFAPSQCDALDEVLSEKERELLEGRRIFSLGQTTASALEKRGFKNVIVAKVPTAECLGELVVKTLDP